MKEQGKNNIPKPGIDRLNWALGLTKEEVVVEEPITNYIEGKTAEAITDTAKNTIEGTAGKIENEAASAPEGAVRGPKPEIKTAAEPKNRGRDPLKANKGTGMNKHGDGAFSYIWPKRGLGGGDPTYDDNIRRNKKIKNAAIAIGSVITAGVIVFAATASCRESNKTSNMRTPTTGAATGSPAPRPDYIPAIVSNNEVGFERIGTPEAAAQRFGKDDWSRNPANWTIGESGNLATLNASPDHYVTSVYTNGAIIEGYLDVKQRPENSAFNAVAILISPNQKEAQIRAGSFRVYKDAVKGFEEQKSKLIAREMVEQPGVRVLSACLTFFESRGWINTVNLGTIDYIARTYGLDNYSKDPRNWFLGENGNLAVLRAPNDGTVTMIDLKNELVAETYFDAPTRDRNINDAISAVFHPNQGIATGRGFSARKAIDGNATELFNQIGKQHLDREKIEQPGVFTYLIGNCEYRITVQPPYVPPTPEVIPPCGWPETKEQAALAFGFKGDAYSTNPQNWTYVTDEKAWFLKRDDANDHRVVIGNCNIAEVDNFIIINKVDPYQVTIVNGELGPYTLEVRSAKIFYEKGAAAANKLFNKYVSKHNDILPTLAKGFIPELYKSNR